jgi:hypothetical protein
MSLLRTLLFPQMSNFWENVVTSFYLTSQAKTEFKWQLLELTKSQQFPKWNAGRWVDEKPQTDYRFLYFVQRMLEVQSNIILSYNFPLHKHFTLCYLRYLETQSHCLQQILLKTKLFSKPSFQKSTPWICLLNSIKQLYRQCPAYCIWTHFAIFVTRIL